MSEMPTAATRSFPLHVRLLSLGLLAFILAMFGAQSRAHAAPVSHTFAAIQTAAAGADYSQTAARNGYVILQAWETARMHELKAQNPSLKVLVYKNLAYSAAKANATAPPSTGVSTNEAPSSWYLLNTSGQRVLPNGFTWMSAMDIGNREYQERWASNVIAELETQGWDGVFMDDANPTIKYAYNPSSVAKYPNDATYSAAMESALAYIGPRVQAHGKLAIANFSCWAEYHDQLNGWLNYLSGALDEMFVKWGSNSGEGYRPESQWKEQVEEASYAAAHGKIFLGFTQGAEGEVQAARYGYASLLLGADSAASYSFIPNYSSEAWMPEFEYQIGEPTGAYRKDTSGLYMREFTNGLVVVNPSTSTRTVNFGGSYSGSGLTDATEAALAPDTALVLTLNGKNPTPVATTPEQAPSPKPVVTSPKPVATTPTKEAPASIGVTVTVGPEQTAITWSPPKSVVGQVANYEVRRDNHAVARTKKRRRVEHHVKRGAYRSYQIVARGKHGKVVARSRLVGVKAGAFGRLSYPAAPSAA
jgi:hypothetical protein